MEDRNRENQGNRMNEDQERGNNMGEQKKPAQGSQQSQQDRDRENQQENQQDRERKQA